MILIVGHGPSAGRVSHSFVDKQEVVRLRTQDYNREYRAIDFIGTRTDFICSSDKRYEESEIEFWHLQGELRVFCAATLKPFKPGFKKPTTGLSAVIIARNKYPSMDIGVIGFDYTLHPERAKHWRHDAYAECECINSLNVVELL